jgi:hypothetical protein
VASAAEPEARTAGARDRARQRQRVRRPLTPAVQRSIDDAAFAGDPVQLFLVRFDVLVLDAQSLFPVLVGDHLERDFAFLRIFPAHHY